ncbi:MAG TPA: prepilin-type N-terminal cleavage/methylation domain-containing protein [Candidatus Xenobia bacterium]|jgi:type IV fimbrial biogenesis protein FimT
MRRGFTLMEIMVVLAILGLLLAIGIPSFNYFKSNNTMRSSADTLLSDVRLAHDQARQNADGAAFVGPVATPAVGTGVDVEVFTVANGKPNHLLQQMAIDSQFSPGCQNLPTAAQLIAAKAPVGAYIEFSGPSGQYVLAFQSNGVPVLPPSSGNGGSALSGCGLQLKNSAMTLEVLVSTLGSASEVQQGATGLSGAQQAIMNTPPTPF